MLRLELQWGRRRGQGSGLCPLPQPIAWQLTFLLKSGKDLVLPLAFCFSFFFLAIVIISIIITSHYSVRVKERVYRSSHLFQKRYCVCPALVLTKALFLVG